jgi:hypothetical protein
VLVALAQGAAVALFDVGRPPGGINVVRDQAALDVGADPGAWRGRDEDDDLAVGRRYGAPAEPGETRSGQR